MDPVPAQPPRDKKSVVHEYVEPFLRKLFVNGFHFEECFCKICDLGCPRDEFGQLLWATCMLMSAQTIPLINGGKLTKAQLKGLPKRLRTLAKMIAALNGSQLGPGNEVIFMPYAPEGTHAREVRDFLVRRYEMLPGMLNVYSYHLERFTKITRNTIKRLTTAHVEALRILQYVERHTGSPRYADVAELLEQGCLIEGKQKNVPRFLTAEGLAKLHQRWGKAVLPNLTDY